MRNNKIIFKTLMLKGEAGATIASMERTGHVGTTDIYTITFSDGTTAQIPLENMSAIISVEKTSQTDTQDIYTITCADGSTQTFSVLNHNADFANMEDHLDDQIAEMESDIAEQTARIDYFLATQTGTINGTKRTETVLFESATPSRGTVIEVNKRYLEIEDEIDNYDYIEIYYGAFDKYNLIKINPSDVPEFIVPLAEDPVIWAEDSVPESGGSSNYRAEFEMYKYPSEAKLHFAFSRWRIYTDINYYANDEQSLAQSGIGILKIVGIKYTTAETSKDPELTDVRVGADGTTYNSAGAAVRGQITAIKEDLSDISDVVFDETLLTTTITASGWKLKDDGLCVRDDSYKMDKYPVTAGDTIKVVSDHLFQFQINSNVPSSGTSTRVGETYGIGTFHLTVPETATYLIVSTLLADSQSAVYFSTNKIEQADGKADEALESAAEAQTKAIEAKSIADANSDDIDDVKSSVGYEKSIISSRNLNKTPYDASYTASGLTVITNEDNTLSLSGDPTETIWWPLTTDPSYRWLLPAGTYTLSGGVDAWNGVNLRLFAGHDDTTAAAEYTCAVNEGRPVTFITTQDYWAYVRIVINARNGETSGTVLKPQVEAGTSKTAYQSPWEEEVEYNTKITDVEQDMNTYKHTRPFARTGNLVQYRPVKDNPVTMRIDFESVDGFTEIRFTHCGRNLLDMQKAIVDGSTITINGLTGVKNNGVVHVTGKNTSNNWTKLFDGYMSSNDYWLPAGHYSILKLGLSTKNQDDTSANESNTFVKTMPWQAVQWYVSVRGGHTVEVDYPLVILSGDERPSEYIPFVGEHVVVSLPQTVYGGWIDINNSVLHITKNLSNGALVDAEETTYDLDSITLTEIDEINTLYSIDGVVSASGTLVDFSKPDFDMPVPDFYLNDGYLQGKIDRINELAETSMGNGDMFFMITDCHLENNRLYSVPLIRELSKNCNIPRLFNCGDVSDGMYSVTKDYLKLVKENFGGKTHYVYGNHEYMATSENKMNYWFNLGADANRHGNFKRNYYYVDNAQSRIRYFILNGYKENASATNWSTGYEEAQRTWLQNEALNVESGWGIIVFTHNTFFIDWETGLKSGYDGSTVEAMLNVLDAYDGNGEVIAVFGGHMHVDAVEHTTGGIPVILTTCDKPQPYISSGHADFDSSVRIINTISEQAFDVVLIDRDNRTIKLVRIGCPALNLVDDVTDGYVEERTVSFKQLT